MEDLVIVQGIVIRHAPVGEYDWTVTIFTAQRGRITAFARGARRPGGALSGLVEPFCYGTFKLYVGKSSYNIVEADIQNYFEYFRKDLEASCYGAFLLELTNYYTRENSEDIDLLKLLYLSLRALEKPSFDNRLVRAVFEIRALAIEGEYPGIPEGIPYSDTTRYTLDFIVNSKIESIYTFKVSDEVLRELRDIALRFRKRFVDRDLKSLEMLEMFEKE